MVGSYLQLAAYHSSHHCTGLTLYYSQTPGLLLLLRNNKLHDCINSCLINRHTTIIATNGEDIISLTVGQTEHIYTMDKVDRFTNACRVSDCNTEMTKNVSGEKLHLKSTENQRKTTHSPSLTHSQRFIKYPL